MKALFKNATAYRMIEPGELNRDLRSLKDRPISEPAPGQMLSVGWVNPFDESMAESFYLFGDDPINGANLDGYTILCMVTIKKNIKSGAINREVARKVAEIRQKEGRSPDRKEYLNIKDDVIALALPGALPEEFRTYAYIDWENNLLVIDESSANKCDTFTSELRGALGSLPVVPLQSANLPHMVMCSWLTNNSSPPHIKLLGDAIFKNPTDLSQTVTVKHTGIDSAPVTGALSDGLVPQMISLSWSVTDTSRLDFKLTDAVILKSISFSDELLDINDDYDDAEAEYQAAMLINCETITKIILGCFALFGGMAEH